MKYLEVINLDKYQHYQTGRETIWIKVYLKMLNDYKFQQLTDSERWLFVGLIMIAVECSNSIPYGSSKGADRGALWVYKRVCYGHRKGAYRVAIGVKKMIKLGLLREKNAITERKKEREERKKEPFYKNQPMIKKYGKWHVIEKIGEILFTGKESDIEWK